MGIYGAYLMVSKPSGESYNISVVRMYFSGADFTKAEIIRVKADIIRAHFSDVSQIKSSILPISAYWNLETKWPEGFTPPCPVSTPDDPCWPKKEDKAPPAAT